METCELALPPKGQVQNRDVTIPNQRFRIATGDREVELMCDPVSAFSTGGAEDSAHTRVPQGLVDVCKPILIAAGQKVAPSVEGMSADFDL
jgi:hypothetical protein